MRRPVNESSPLADVTFNVKFVTQSGVAYDWESITWPELQRNLETCLLLGDTITHISKNEA